LELGFRAACQAFLNLPNMEIKPAERELATSALVLIKENHITPMDSILAATAISEKLDFVVSTDRHFRRVEGLKWKHFVESHLEQASTERHLENGYCIKP